MNNQQKRTMQTSDMPPEFIQVQRLTGSFTMKTPELINLSTRLEDLLQEILKASNVMIDKIICELKQYIGFFYKLCEDIGKLDMLQSLAEVSIKGRFVRPKFGEFTEICEARHPILEFLLDEKLVPNLISISKDYNVQIITGPNGSGKSIYIRQVMLLQVMAQIGCYLPAQSAIIHPVERMFARIYLEDNMEYGASAFILEMKEIKYMMALPSENSLFIIDELCRSTSVDEGTALAMAIIEKFVMSSAFVYVTTHYTRLTRLYDMYPSVKVWQMETVSNGDEPRNLTLDFEFRLAPGVTQLKHYGVYIVKNIWPESLCEDVYKILKSIKQRPNNQTYETIDEKIRLKYEFETNLKKFKSRGKLTRENFLKLYLGYTENLKKLGFDLNPLENNCEPIDENAGNHFMLNDQLDSTSYQDISRFLNEDSDNVNKLIPEVAITTIDENFPNENHDMQQDVSSKSAVSEQEESKDTFKSCSFDEDEANSIMDEIESRYSQSFGDAEEFTFTQPSEKTIKIVNNNTNYHLFPNVQIIEGVNNPTPPTPPSPPPELPITKANTTPTTKTSMPHVMQIHENVLNFALEDSTISRPLESVTFENIKSNSNDKSKSSTLMETATKSGSSEIIFASKPKQLKTILKRPQQSTETSSSLNTVKKIKKRFVPPRKLTKKEIEKEFLEQDRQIYESSLSNNTSELSKCLSRILQRPSVKQAQNAKHLAFVRRTDDGRVEVIPTKPEPPKKMKFKRLLSSNTCSNVDVAMFSDQNAESFERFINSKEENFQEFRFKFDMHQMQLNRETVSNSVENFPGPEMSLAEHVANSSQVKKTFCFNPQFSDKKTKPETQRVSFNKSYTPQGFYKENKESIENILNKYNKPNQSFYQKTLDSNVFETCSDFSDLDV